MNKKRKTFIIVLGILAIILGIWPMIEGLKYIKEKADDKVVTVGELVEKFQSQLPIESVSDSYKMSITGLEVRNDSLVYMTTVEGNEQFVTLFVSDDYRNQLYKGLLEDIVNEYDGYLLTRTACDEEMVISYMYYDAEGNLLTQYSYSADVYKPLL